MISATGTPIEYFTIPGGFSFFDAYRQCAAKNGQLSEITTTTPGNTPNDILQANAQRLGYMNMTTNFWLSIFNPYKVDAERGVNATQNPFYFMDGTPLSNDLVSAIGVSTLQSSACSYINQILDEAIGVPVFDNTNQCSMGGIGSLCRTAGKYTAQVIKLQNMYKTN